MRTTIATFVKQEDAINAWVKDYDNMCSLIGPGNIKAFSPSSYYEYEIYSPSMIYGERDLNVYSFSSGCSFLYTKLEYGKLPRYKCDYLDNEMLSEECCFGKKDKCYCKQEMGEIGEA